MTTDQAVVNQLKLPNRIRSATVIASILGTSLISRPASSRTVALSLTTMALCISHAVSDAYEMEGVFPKLCNKLTRLRLW